MVHRRRHCTCGVKRIRQRPPMWTLFCGLAERLANTMVKAATTWRVQDAMRILDAFPDQHHPKIRSTRGNILDLNDAPARWAVAAYGPAKGLPADAAHNRRRLWWRSAGPFGQLRVRLAYSLRPQAAAADRQAPCASAESLDVARLLDSLDGQPSSTVRQPIEKASQQYGRLPSLLLAHAEADAAEGANWHCLALAAEVVRAIPADLEAVCCLAQAVRNSPYGYGVAVELLESLPAVARQTTEVRVTLANLHRDAGNFALAVAAYGDPRDLDGYDRRFRRRSMVRGLLQRRRSGDSHSGTPLDLTTFDPVDSAIAQVLDKSDSLLDRPDECRTMLQAAIAEHGRQPLLLLSMARAERLVEDRASCVVLIAEALTNIPVSPLITAMGIWELWWADYDTEALRMLADAPDGIKEIRTISVTAGYIYHYWNLVANAFYAFGDHGLEAWQRRQRRASWWRSGGPFYRLRNSILAQENSALSSVPLPEPQLAALAALPLSAPISATVRGDLSSYRMGLVQRTLQSPGVFSEWETHVFAPGLTVLAAFALTLIEHLRWPADRLWQNMAAAAAVTAATVVTAWIVGRVTRRVAARMSIAVCSAVAAVFLLRLSRQWLFGAGLVLATLTLAIIASYSMWVVAVTVVPRIRAGRWRRNHAETAVLSDLLDLLSDLAVIQRRRDAGARHKWMTDLESAAVAVERFLPHRLRSGDPVSQSAIAAHTQDIATALRALKSSVALPDRMSWDRVTTQLQALATALARGDFEGLSVRPPTVAIPERRRSWWWQAIQITRTLLVIFAPPLVAFLLPLVAPLSGPGVAWLRLATLVWALLAAIIVLDPKIAEKVSQMRAVLSLLREAAPPRGVPGQADSYGPAEEAPRTQLSPGARTQNTYPEPAPRSPRARTRKAQRRSSR